MSGKYDDIIGLEHHVSKKHPQMPMSDRAAQFSPFAALTGYGDAVKETARLTDEKQTLDEETLRSLNETLGFLKNSEAARPEITVTYFIPDEKKTGGSYATRKLNLKRIDDYRRRLVAEDGSEIPLDDIAGIECELFERELRNY